MTQRAVRGKSKFSLMNKQANVKQVGASGNCYRNSLNDDLNHKLSDQTGIQQYNESDQTFDINFQY